MVEAHGTSVRIQRTSPENGDELWLLGCSRLTKGPGLKEMPRGGWMCSLGCSFRTTYARRQFPLRFASPFGDEGSVIPRGVRGHYSRRELVGRLANEYGSTA
ncbi:hypothetical protein ACRALDRAFT_1076479, partial [Sodiomyces alcalophilus JCM 7366]|uniref:uncharacterized protein n=1 Tax=Sodiomyces alcalophilus JCM 7366 TaxID=591952 RepID=UPI0039B462C1